MTQESILRSIQNELEKLSAAQVADFFLSPYVSEKLLNEATAEPGPSMWIVNRSDVYDESLRKLSQHPIEGMASRAKAKLSARYSSLNFLAPPEVPESFEEIPEYSVEDLLGHPLCPFEGMIFFARSLNEDHRSSAALSLTRRVVEYPPNWSVGMDAKQALMDVFGGMLIGDPSDFVRAYAARIPFLPPSLIQEGLSKEKNDLVRGRLLQNPALNEELLKTFATDFLNRSDHKQYPFTETVLALDERLCSPLRGELLKKDPLPLARLIHEWFLTFS